MKSLCCLISTVCDIYFRERSESNVGSCGIMVHDNLLDGESVSLTSSTSSRISLSMSPSDPDDAPSLFAQVLVLSCVKIRLYVTRFAKTRHNGA